MNGRTFLKAAGGSLTMLAVSAHQALGSAPAPAPRAQSSSASPGADVVGAGAFGGWAALYLREMGLSVTMIDAYGPGNSRASSGGETRQIRPGYGDREIYTRWVIEALQRWNARQAEWGKTLFYQTGELSLAREWTQNLKDSKIVLDRLGVENHVIAHDDLVRRFPQVNVDGIDFGFYVPSTGVLKRAKAAWPSRRRFRKRRPPYRREGGAGRAGRRPAAGRQARDWIDGERSNIGVRVRTVAAQGLA